DEYLACRQLGECSLLCRRGHPGEIRNASAEGDQEIRSHRLRPGFRFRREIALRVKLGNRLRESTIGGGDGDQLPGGRFCCTGENLAEEGKMLLGHRLR